MNSASPQPISQAGTERARPVLAFHGVRKSFATEVDEIEAIRKVDLDIGEGEFVSIVGPSGCGKSTLLQISAGLLAA